MHILVERFDILKDVFDAFPEGMGLLLSHSETSDP